MATIKIKRGTTTPAYTSLVQGEPAVDTSGNKFFIRTGTAGNSADVKWLGAEIETSPGDWTNANKLATQSAINTTFMPKAGGTFTGAVSFGQGQTAAGEIRLLEDTDDGSNYTAFRGSARAANITYVMPTTDPTSGQVLSASAPSTNVSTLSWVDAGAASTVTVTNDDTTTTLYPIFSTATSGSISPKVDSNGMTYDASTNQLNAISVKVSNILVLGDATDWYVTDYAAADIMSGIFATSTFNVAQQSGDYTTYNFVEHGGAGGSTINFGVGSADTGTKAINIGTASGSSSTTTITIGSTTGTSTITNNGNLTVTGDVAVNGGDITTTSTGTATVFNTNATTVNAFGAATELTMGSGVSGCSTTIRGGTLVGNTTSQNVFETTATTVNAFGAATTMAIGNTATAAQTVNMFTSSTGASTYNIATGATTSATTKTLNLGTGGGGSSTTNVNLGSNNGGTFTVNSPSTMIGTSSAASIDAVSGASTSVFETPTTIDFAGKATSLSIGNTVSSAQTVNMFTASTGASTYNFATGGTTTGLTKTINVGTSGSTGSTTTINIGTGSTGTAANVNLGSTGASGSTVTVNKDLVVTGNLTVNGTTVTVNSTTVTIDDPVFTLGGDTAPSSDDSKDRGIEFRWHNGSTPLLGFMGWDRSAAAFALWGTASESSGVYSTGQTAGRGKLHMGSELRLHTDANNDSFYHVLTGNSPANAIHTITLPNFSGTLYISGGTDVAVADGGTGLSSYTTGQIVYASGTTTLAGLTASSTAGAVVASTGAGAAPEYKTISLTNGTVTSGSGTLTLAVQNAAADGSTKGLAAFNATSFSAASGVVDIATVDGGTYP